MKPWCHGVNMEDPSTHWKNLPQCHCAHHLNTSTNAPMNFIKRIFSLPLCKALRYLQFCNSVLNEHLPGGVGGRWKNA